MNIGITPEELDLLIFGTGREIGVYEAALYGSTRGYGRNFSNAAERKSYEETLAKLHALKRKLNEKKERSGISTSLSS